jgi:hypothetical protein
MRYYDCQRSAAAARECNFTYQLSRAMMAIPPMPSLAAVGYNFRRLLTWLAASLRLRRLASLRVGALVNTANSSALNL